MTIRRSVLTTATVVVAAACTALTEPAPELSGVIDTALPTEDVASGMLLVREVKGSRDNTIVLGFADGTEILVKQKGRKLRPGSISDLKPETRIRFEPGPIAVATIPPIYGAIRIWVVQ
jgi:hypothetical protein